MPLGKIPIVIGGTGKRTWSSSPRTPTGGTSRSTSSTGSTTCARRAGDARVSVQQMFAFVPQGVDRAAIEEPARRRFGFGSLVVGGRSEMIDHFSAMRERGVERFYVWFADFAPPATLEAFGAEVISAF